MKMSADAAFSIGETHTTCQDYAYAKVTDQRAYLIISDGCSSSPHSDVGARILTHQVASLLEGGMSLQRELFGKAIVQSRRLSAQLGLPQMVLDCTLLVAEYDRTDVRILAAGDGVIALRYKKQTQDQTQDRKLTGVEMSTPTNTPGYLNYLHDPQRSTQYHLQDQGVCYRILGTDRRELHSSGLHWLSLTLPVKDLDTLILCSDGISSFSKLSTESALDHLSSFPSSKGRFVQRRLRKFIRKTCPKNDWHHKDDIAIAAFSFQD